MYRLRTDRLVRGTKVVLLASFGVYAGLVTLGNVVDPETNLAFVEHVLRMDTTFGRPALRGRAIEDPNTHRMMFGLIVATEAMISGLCLWGSIRLVRAIRCGADHFHAAKATGVSGLLLGLLLWFLGFQVVGGEWFVSWQSDLWNGLDPASRITTFLLGSLIFVTLRND
jgi:predicted small integral membrane protein